MQATAVCLSMRTKLCVRLCICIEAVRYCRQELFVRISRENFTAACVMSYRFASFRCTSPWSYFPWSAVLPVVLFLPPPFFFCRFQYLPLSGSHKNNGFRPSKGERESLVSTCASAFLIYSTLLFSLMCRGRGRQTLLSNSNIRVTRSRSVDDEALMIIWKCWRCRFDRRDFVRPRSTGELPRYKGNLLCLWPRQAEPGNSARAVSCN